MSITRLQQARQMYAMGQRVGFQGGGGQIGGTANMSGGSTSNDNHGGPPGGGATSLGSGTDLAGPDRSAVSTDSAWGKAKAKADETERRNIMNKNLESLKPNIITQGLDFYGKYGLIPNAARLAGKFFGGIFSGPKISTGDVGPAGIKTDGTYGTVQDAIDASRRNEFDNNYQGGDGITTLPNMFDVAGPVVEEGITTVANDPDFEHRFRGLDRTRQDKQGQLDPAIMDMISKLYT